MTLRTSNPKNGVGYSVVYVGLLFDYLRSRNVDAAAVLGQVAPERDGFSLTRIAFTRWREMLFAAARVLNDPLLSLHLGQTITPNHLGVLGYVMLSCTNAGAALQRWRQYERLVHDLSPLLARSEGDSLVLEWELAEGAEVCGIIDETAVTAYVQFMRNITGQTVRAEGVFFRHAAPMDCRPYEAYFGCPVLFDQPQLRIRLPLAASELALRQADAALLGMMEHQATALLDTLPHSNDLVRAVRSCIAKQAREGDLSIDHVAAMLKLSSRTLHRRLAQDGWNFRDLRNGTRRNLAQAYLRDPTLTLSEIAWLLGYSEHSAFTRAFRQWTGLAPRFWREEDEKSRGQRVKSFGA